MTAQEIFDKSATHLLTQNRRAFTARDNGDEFCKYKAPDGSMCAVGVLIKDEFYFPNLEGQALDDDELLCALTQSGINNVRFGKPLGFFDVSDLLHRLQYIHDQTPVADWKSELQNLANWMGLSPAVLDK